MGEDQERERKINYKEVSENRERKYKETNEKMREKMIKSRWKGGREKEMEIGWGEKKDLEK